MVGYKIQKKELMEAAEEEGLDPDQPYDELREAIDITECKHCGQEYHHEYSDKFCTETCEVEHINEHDHL